MKCVFKYLTLFSLVSTHLFGDLNDSQFLPLADTEQNISCLVNGSVNAITGDYVESHQDLMIPGPEPLTFERSYSSSQCSLQVLWSGWRHNHTSYLKNKIQWISPDDGMNRHVRIVDFSGSSTLVDGHPQIGPLNAKSKLNKGLSNLGKGIISGRTNHKNTQVTSPVWDLAAIVKLGSGETREYVRRTRDGNEVSSGHFDIICKTMPGGSRVFYDYGWVNECICNLKTVQATHKDSKIIYSSLKFSKSFDQTMNYRGLKKPTLEFADKYDSNLHTPKCIIETDDGRKATYTFQPAKIKHKKNSLYYLMTQAECTDKPTCTYEYTPFSIAHSKISCSRKPNNRYIMNEYYYDKKNDVSGTNVTIRLKHDVRIGRVKLQKAPVGTDNTPIVTHRYFYNINVDYQPLGSQYIPDIKNGYTEVYDAHNHKAIYIYDETQRLTALQKFSGRGNYQFYSQEGYIWGSQDSQDFGNLICKYVVNGAGVPQCARVFSYDAAGNVIRDQFYGVLCGNNPHTVVLGANYYPIENGCDCYVKHRAYSNDGLNLLLAEVEPNGRYTQYSYVPGTDWLDYKMISLNGEIKKREFFHYSKEGVLIEKIEDDGSSLDRNNLSGVTERRLSQSLINETAPGYGLPIVQGSSYLDLETNKPVLLHNIVNTYPTQGCRRLIRQDHHDGPGSTYQYSESWDYDSHGNVIKEQNALGDTIYREYDVNDNLSSETGPSKTVKYTYDYSNRLIRIDEIPANGPVLTMKHSYDYCGNRTSTEDYFGHVTYFEYDDFGRLIKTISPAVQDETGKIINPVTTRTYDLFGNVTSMTDPLGNTVTTTYTVRGKPITVHYPDGSSESFEYNIDGSVRKSVAKNGMYTLYAYDYDYRPINTEVYSAEGQLLTKSSATYNAFHMTSSTDAEGNTTYFTYDGAGRKATIRKNDHITSFEYDSLGRIHKTLEQSTSNESDVVVKVQEHDLLNRVIEDRLEDGHGNVLRKTSYEYDVNGNRTKVTQYLENGPSTTSTKYNGLGLPTAIIDSLGNETIIEYDYNFRNDLNQSVLKKTTTDPLGNQLILVMDTLNRIKVSERKNSIGETVAKQELFYDAAGNKSLLKETVYVLGKPDRDVLTAWTYNAMGQAISVEEAVGTPEHKVTSLRYNIFGQKESIIKPDGSKICHAYDSLGRLAKFYSEDGSIDYEYYYDLCSRPIVIKDLVNHSENVRSYDVNGYLIKEVLGNGLTIQYEYDHLGRPIREILPDNSSVEFVYNAVGLREIRRFNSNNENIYSYVYEKHDLAGNILACGLIGDVGNLSYSHDKLGRTTSMHSPFWSANIPENGFDAAGNLLEEVKTDALGITQCKYTYDDLYQVTSETGALSHQYQNDSLYNRISKDGVPNAINVLNQLLSDADSIYKYDLNGNLTEKDSEEQITQYNYDALDRLVEVRVGRQIIKYTYDSFNRRLSKTIYDSDEEGILSKTSKCNYLYQGQNDLGSVNENGNYIELRILGLGKGAEIGASIGIEIKGRIFAPLHDRAGNIMSLIDIASSQVVETYRYSAFGEEQIYDENGLQVDESVIGNPWRFSSKRYDEETGFVYFGRRYYDAKIGRWITPDPIGFDGGPNLYAYVLNSPLTHFDSYGLERETDREDANYSNAERGTPIRDFGSMAVEKVFGVSDHVSDCGDPTWRLDPVEAIGIIIEFVSLHLIPYGFGVQELFCKVGQCMQGNFKDKRVQHSVNGTLTYGQRVDNHAIMEVGGILNPFEGFINHVAWICGAFGDTEVRYTSNASHGLISDLLECAAQILGLPTNSVKHFTENLRDTLASVGPDGTVTIIAHSQGGLIAYRSLQQLTAEERAKINVITVASAKIISSEEFGLINATNYISTCDLVPFIGNPINYTSARFSGHENVTFIDSSSFPLIDHGFMNEIYQRVLTREGLIFQKQNGIL